MKARARYSEAITAMNTRIQRAVALLSLNTVSGGTVFSTTVGAAASRTDTFDSCADSLDSEFTVSFPDSHALLKASCYSVLVTPRILRAVKAI